ncbi:MAG: gamma-glutamyltransferase [Myxococcota bacterium]|nr:gamma-glutamyltransferase [Myxococcota bacterium]
MENLSSPQSKGVVSAGDAQTAEAGKIILEQGGNAFDAVVASGFAAFVCEVALCGPLGGGVMLAKTAQGTTQSVEFFGRTPGLGGPQPSQLDFGEETIDFGVTTQSFKVGKGAAALGLALPGLVDIHKKWGRLPLHRVAEPAVRLGRDGFVVGAPMAYILELISPIFSWTPESKALVHIDGRLPTAGERMFNADLATVLEDIADNPSELQGLYADFARHFGPSQGGLITARDLTSYEIEYADPIAVRMRDWSLATMPSPSSGGSLIALGLRLLEGLGDDTRFLSLDHLVQVALTQRMLLDVRTPEFDEQLRDPAFIKSLLSRSNVNRLRECLARPPIARPDNHLGSTTQISVIDKEGGVAAMTLTNGEGCGCVIPGTGIEVNNLLGEADINPRGFHCDPPGTRMSTMMAPTVGLNGQGDLIALGSGGSNRLRNAIMMTLCNLIEYGCSPADAVSAPRLHLDASDGDFELNVEVAEHHDDMLDGLREVFPKLVRFPGRNMFFGGVHTALSLNGQLSGIGDARRGGCSAIAR